MGSWSDTSGSESKAKPVVRRPSSNYRVRFRHGVYPNEEGLATRADIKKYDYFFGGEQTWVGTPGSVDFIDESAQVAADLGAMELSRSAESSRRPARRITRTKTAERIPHSVPNVRRTTELSIRPASYAAISSAYSSGAPSTATSTASDSPRHTSFNYGAFQHRRHTSPATSSISSLDGSSILDWQHDAPTSAGPLPTMHSTRAAWPLADPEEAQLFRFYVNTVSQWWDVTNPHNLFKEVVPQLALSNTMLLNALLMKASQHLENLDTAHPARAYMYHERLLQELIPYLADNGSIKDEATLVAAMFLRAFEELHAGTRGQFSLSTYELFHGPNSWNFNMSSPIVQACYVAHVRFEIFQSLLNSPSLRIDYRNDVLPALTHPTNDIAWGNRIAWIAARCLQWAESEPRMLSEWQTLSETVDEWERERPSSFNAFYYRDANLAEGRHFPDLWFPSIAHVNGHQRLRIARISLAVNHPTHGIANSRAFAEAGEVEVTKWLKEMVAVARCNPHAVQTSTSIAAHTIHKFAGCLRDPMDQSDLMQFLEEVDITGWSTDLTRRWLKVQWGWPLQDNSEFSNDDFM